MEIEYCNLGKASVKYLIQSLQKIIDDNPEINFHKVGVSLNSEYVMNGVEFRKWQHDGRSRVDVDIY